MKRVLGFIVGLMVLAYLSSLALNWNYQRTLQSSELGKTLMERVVFGAQDYDLTDLFPAGTTIANIEKQLLPLGYICEQGGNTFVCQVRREKFVLSPCDDRIAVVADHDAAGIATKTVGRRFLTCL